MKKHLTKIVATIGPACESEEMIEKLILAGVDVFRFNLKHNNLDWHSTNIAKVYKVASKVGKDIGTLVDLQGPEIRVNIEKEEIKIEKGKEYSFDANNIYISHPLIIPHLKAGQKIYADDGSLHFAVVKKNDKVDLLALRGGVLKNKKNFNIPGADFPLPALSKCDIEALDMAHKAGADFIALSFVRSEHDVINLREEIHKIGYNAKIIAKIETVKAIDNIDGIIKATDGLMVARGDLGVEASLEKVPFYQKKLIRLAFKKGIPVVTATQMLQSMVDHAYPTRAEVSDVANAFYDLTDAVMLSAETASGKHPLAAVSMMRKILEFNEEKNVIEQVNTFDFDMHDRSSLICNCAYDLYKSFKDFKQTLAGFLVFTQSGTTARLISRYRPLVPIFTFVPDKKIADSLSIDFGVHTFTHHVTSKNQVVKEDILKAIKTLKDNQLVKKGDVLIVLHGDYWAETGGTSTVKLVEA